MHGGAATLEAHGAPLQAKNHNGMQARVTPTLDMPGGSNIKTHGVHRLEVTRRCSFPLGHSETYPATCANSSSACLMGVEHAGRPQKIKSNTFNNEHNTQHKDEGNENSSRLRKPQLTEAACLERWRDATRTFTKRARRELSTSQWRSRH